MAGKITLKKGDKAPDFKLKNSDDENVSLKDFKGKWYFQIKSLIEELKQNEEELVRIQKK